MMIEIYFFIVGLNLVLCQPATWRIQPTSNVRPPSREYGLFSFDSAQTRGYLFGGNGPNGVLDDTWEIRQVGSQWVWREVAQNSRPTPRFGFVGGIMQAASDRSSYFVIATGDRGGVRLGDVWALQLSPQGLLTGWFQVKLSGDTVTPRYGSIGGVVGDKLYISHGFDKGRFSDTFELDLSQIATTRSATWKLIHKETNEYDPSSPHARCLGGGTVTPNQEIVLFGGCLTGGGTGGPCPSNDGWVLNNNREWERAENHPAANLFSSMTSIESGARVLMYGGDETTDQVISISKTLDEEINVLNIQSGEWIRYMTSGTVPDKRKSPHIFSLPNGDIVMWGGQSISSGEYNTDVYVLSGNFNETPTNSSSRPWFTWWMLHGIFMTLGWGIFLQLGAFVARYFRRKDPFWFKFHRALQSVGLLFAIVGVYFGFRSANTIAAKHFSFAHSILGLIITIIGIQQPLNAVFRPHPGERFRKIWSLFHKNLGRLGLVLALVNITLGLFMAVVVTYVWALWFTYLSLMIITYFVFEYFLRTKWRKIRKTKDDDEEMEKYELADTPKDDKKQLQLDESVITESVPQQQPAT